MKKVHIIPHTHWDREWYFTTEESRILLVNNMEEIFQELESNSKYPHYVLDGQTAILEDYLRVKPESKERIKKLVQEGKLIIGPWYTQTDTLVVGAESIVRNLLYGIKDSLEFGDYMKIGYLPDSFGHSSQLPQIFNGFDIKDTIFWRGRSERHGCDKTEFYWLGDGDSKVLALVLPLGYATGRQLPLDETLLKEKLDLIFSFLDKRTPTNNLIIANGNDQMPIQTNIFLVMDKLKTLYPDRQFFLSKYENVLKEARKIKNLSRLKGEWLDGKYSRVHRTIYSSRMDIKAENVRIENKLTNILEPLAAIAHFLGFEYHHGLIELIWKEIMKNHAHDSIGCCCSDEVHKEIVHRFFIAEEKTDQLVRFYQRKIADAVKSDRKEDRLMIFNLLPHERKETLTATFITKLKNFKMIDTSGENIIFEVIEKKQQLATNVYGNSLVRGDDTPFDEYTIAFVASLPSMGYKTFYIVKDDNEIKQGYKKVDAVETEFYKILVNANGTLNIFDKQTKNAFDQVLLIEDGSDDGDGYDYSPLADDLIVSSKKSQANFTIKENKFESVINIKNILKVPSDLDKRKAKIIDASINIKLEIIIAKNSPVIKVKVIIDNSVKDHRMRLLIPTGIASSFSISDNQFGAVKREVYDEAMTLWEEEKWQERPDCVFPMLSYVGLSTDNHGVAVLTNSSREYEIIGKNMDTIAITLFRSVGFLGKPNLVRRPGRASGLLIPTPDSQLLGKITLDLAILVHPNSTLKANVAFYAKQYTTPVYYYNKTPYDLMDLNPSNITLPKDFSLLEECNNDVVMSAFKKAEKEEAYILRLYNAKEAVSKVEFATPFTKVFCTNLNEERRGELKVIDGKLKDSLKQNQVKTFILKSN